MKVFISWSGQRSKTLARELAVWLKLVLQRAEPWMSDLDIRAGTRWALDIGNRLKTINAGIICITRENAVAPWIQFEAGALSKVDGAMVTPYLLDLKPESLSEPLQQFQAVQADKLGTYNLLLGLNELFENARLTSDAISATFDKWWPDLEAKIAAIPASDQPEPEPPSEREQLAEIRNGMNELRRLILGRKKGPSTPVTQTILNSNNAFAEEPAAIRSLIDDFFTRHGIEDGMDRSAIWHALWRYRTLDNLSWQDALSHYVAQADKLGISLHELAKLM